MKLRITVTKEILEKSKMCKDEFKYEKSAGRNCAISLAIRDIMPDAFVSTFYLYPSSYSWDDLEMGGVKLPDEATRFIREFDNLEPSERVEMSPISFEIDLPEEVINRIDISEVTELLKNHPTLQFV